MRVHIFFVVIHVISCISSLRIRRQVDVDTTATSPCFTIQEEGEYIGTCFGASVSDFESGALENSERLQVLTVIESTVPILPAKGLKHLLNLETLSISFSKLSEIDKDAFQGLTSPLQSLNISNNEIKIIQPYTFSPLKYLKELNLSSNRINLLRWDQFFGLSKMEILDVSNNIIETLPSDVFKSCHGLVRIDLSRNPMIYLPSKLFSKLNYLKFVNLSDIHLTQLPSGLFDSVPSLVELDLSNNYLSSFNADAFNQPQHKMTKLILAVNQLAFLNMEEFEEKLPNLKTVELSPNPWSCSCLTLVLQWMMKRNVEYLPREYFEGLKPVCAVDDSIDELNPDSDVKTCGIQPKPSTTSTTSTTSITRRTTPKITTFSAKPSATTTPKSKNQYFIPYV